MPSPLPNIEMLKVQGRRPSLPEGLRIYAIGDVHGRRDLLDVLLSRIEADTAERPATQTLHVFLGDYIDRGAASRETIDRLIEHGKRSESVFLKGNHELIALRCLREPALFDHWMRLGGLETLASYGIVGINLASGRPIAEIQSAFHDALPRPHFRFFRDLKTSFACGDFFFAHAGVRPRVDLSQQKENDLLWIRDEFLSCPEDFGKIIVHGHTPTREVEVAVNRVNIDTGAFMTGRLTCLVIEDSSLAVIDTR
ncbi:metallophosphoesterase family protein [Bradyrhizobium sp.]|uniref:metallophosphoesterase family protein n=1 Tax=Bradyrhizobium sp. TaxID=376 RepID=UPI0025B8F6D8|nr:metallophosphoesterase family protein [Bradyrhizobium sp.]